MKYYRYYSAYTRSLIGLISIISIAILNSCSGCSHSGLNHSRRINDNTDAIREQRSLHAKTVLKMEK